MSHWTTTKPSKPGWYWWRWDCCSEPSAVKVDDNWHCMENRHVPVNAFYMEDGGEWSSESIPEPEEVQT